MNITDIIARISNKHNLSRNESREIVLDIVNGIRKSLLRGDTVLLRNLGTLSVRTHKARAGVHLDGTRTINPPYKYVHFKTSINFKEELKNDSR